MIQFLRNVTFPQILLPVFIGSGFLPQNNNHYQLILTTQNHTLHQDIWWIFSEYQPSGWQNPGVGHIFWIPGHIFRKPCHIFGKPGHLLEFLITPYHTIIKLIINFWEQGQIFGKPSHNWSMMTWQSECNISEWVTEWVRDRVTHRDTMHLNKNVFKQLMKWFSREF